MTGRQARSKKHSGQRLGRGRRRGARHRRQGGRAPSAARGTRKPPGTRRGRPRQFEPSPVAGLKVELMVTIFDGAGRDAKRVERAGLVRPTAGSVRGVAARAQDRESAARQVARGVEPGKLAGLLAAVGHHHRVRILLKLLGGEATHRLLTKATGLKTGPLYHHVRELRSAGLIGPKIRDLYVLTPKGRRAILAALAMERMCR